MNAWNPPDPSDREDDRPASTDEPAGTENDSRWTVDASELPY